MTPNYYRDMKASCEASNVLPFAGPEGSHDNASSDTLDGASPRERAVFFGMDPLAPADDPHPDPIVYSSPLFRALDDAVQNPVKYVAQVVGLWLFVAVLFIAAAVLGGGSAALIGGAF